MERWWYSVGYVRTFYHHGYSYRILSLSLLVYWVIFIFCIILILIMNLLPEWIHYRLEEAQAVLYKLAVRLRIVSVMTKSGFDIDDCHDSLDREELQDIIWYNMVWQNKRKFFIVWWTIMRRKWYQLEDVDAMREADWYMLVDPHGTTRLILVQKELDIWFNWKGAIQSHKCEKWDAWWEWRWTFQVDKFSSKNPIIPSELTVEEVLQILTTRFRRKF